MVTQIEHCLMGSYLILVYRGFIFYILNLTLVFRPHCIDKLCSGLPAALRG